MVMVMFLGKGHTRRVHGVLPDRPAFEQSCVGRLGLWPLAEGSATRVAARVRGGNYAHRTPMPPSLPNVAAAQRSAVIS